MGNDEAPYAPHPGDGDHNVCGPCNKCDRKVDHCPQAEGGPDDNNPVTRGTRVND